MQSWNQSQIEMVMDKIQQVKEQVHKAIIGQEEIIEQILIAIFADGNVLLEGVPGLGKTELVKAFSNALQLDFKRIQFTPDLMPADVTGTNLIVKEENKNVFQFEPGPIFSNIVLADEINRATAKTQAAMLEAMQEKTVTVGNKTYALPSPYIVLATQNPIENEGTYPLPEAQLDRFLMKCLVKMPGIQELKAIVNLTVNDRKEEVGAVLTKEEIIAYRQVIAQMPVADAVLEYAVRLVAATHKDSEAARDCAKMYIEYGASPRAAQSLIKTAKVRAFLYGRYNVAFEDIRQMAFPVLRHRIVLNFEAVSSQMSEDAVISLLLKELQDME